VQRNIPVTSLQDLTAYIPPSEEIPASRLDAFIVVMSTDRHGTSRCSQTRPNFPDFLEKVLLARAHR
jgi:hypothetical protein